MIVDFDSKFRPRRNTRGKVRFYETDSGSEWDSSALLIGLAKEDLSDNLRDKIMELSGYLQAVQEAIREGIKYQADEQMNAQIEREVYTKRGMVEIDPGIWQYPGKDFSILEFMADYPMKPKGNKRK